MSFKQFFLLQAVVDSNKSLVKSKLFRLNNISSNQL